MCGIIGYCGSKNATQVLLDGLKRLEYRGYDSAGICVAALEGLVIIKKEGKISNLQRFIPPDLAGHCGIGHTRWATHGEVNDINAHPHTDSSGRIALAHNGIIENFAILKGRLQAEGIVFRTQTDSEVIAHLVGKYYQGELEEAVREALGLLQGTYGIVVMHADEPGRIVGARNGSPLVMGLGDHEMLIASDVTAMMAHTQQVIYLEDGEICSLTPTSHRTTDSHQRKVSREVQRVSWELQEIEKGDRETFMEKEIFEQPESIRRAYSGRINRELATAVLGGLNMTTRDLIDIERVKVIAAGTSFYAGMVGAYLLESVARIPSGAELASEIRYRNPIVERNTLYFAVSQSGETADTLYAMKELQRKGARVLGICNVVGSSIPRGSDGGVYIHSGPEIAVASTKAFTSQITVFYLFTLLMARMRDLSHEAATRFLQDLEAIPAKVAQILERSGEIRALAEKYARQANFLFLGRGINYPVAMEGALKLKEISYIHAEGYSAAEIKHGPIALINPQTPCMFLVPNDRLREKVINNIKEVKARRGPVIAIAPEGLDGIRDVCDDLIQIPQTNELMYPYLFVVPMQLFAYYTARFLGRDVDQPRNLAKSVTVE
jgi:glucosamine--fructose-6-phosphate aminotransferase (isomerizing)